MTKSLTALTNNDQKLFNNDHLCDQVAQSLYLIQNKMNKTSQKRTRLINQRKKAVSEHNSSISARSSVASRLDDERKEKMLVNAINKRKSIQDHVQRKTDNIKGQANRIQETSKLRQLMHQQNMAAAQDQASGFLTGIS